VSTITVQREVVEVVVVVVLVEDEVGAEEKEAEMEILAWYY
jgi:hypothetical protein